MLEIMKNVEKDKALENVALVINRIEGKKTENDILIGNLLIAVRDNFDVKGKALEKYCAENFGYSKSAMYRKIKVADVFGTVSVKNNGTFLIEDKDSKGISVKLNPSVKVTDILSDKFGFPFSMSVLELLAPFMENKKENTENIKLITEKIDNMEITAGTTFPKVCKILEDLGIKETAKTDGKDGKADGKDGKADGKDGKGNTISVSITDKSTDLEILNALLNLAGNIKDENLKKTTVAYFESAIATTKNSK